MYRLEVFRIIYAIYFEVIQKIIDFLCCILFVSYRILFHYKYTKVSFRSIKIKWDFFIHIQAICETAPLSYQLLVNKIDVFLVQSQKREVTGK